MTRPAPWNETENAALVQLYFAMLTAATAGKKYNKAAMIREAQLPSYTQHSDYRGKLNARSRGSIEAKLMNATACHRKLTRRPDGWPTAETMANHGYRPLSNYQGATLDAMRKALNYRAESFAELIAPDDEADARELTRTHGKSC